MTKPPIGVMKVHPVVAQLRRERQKRYTQPEMAELIGTSKSNIGDWEYGRFAPNLANLTAWADALGFELALVPKSPAPTTEEAS